MKKEAIIQAASGMNTVFDLLVLLNRIKKDELGDDKACEFTIAQLNYFLNPKRTAGHYHTFTIPKKSGGVRTISAPVKMLKSFQTYTAKLLEAFYDAPDCVTGFVPAKSIIDNAEQHYGREFVFNTDLKDFFPSISQARVWGALKSRPFNFQPKIAAAIAGLCCIQVPKDVPEDTFNEKFQYVLPQGSPASPVLTNIVCHNLDWKLSGVARRFRLHYSRYADDITFSGNQDIFQEDGDFIKELRKVIAAENFTVNDKKTRLQKRHERQEVTGLVVNDKVNVTREYVRSIENLLYIWERHGHNSAFAAFLKHYTPKQNLHRGKPDMEAVIAGKLQYMRMVKGDDNKAWRKLQRRFNRLCGLKSDACGTNVIYNHSFTIDDFEKYTGTTLTLVNEEGIVAPRFTLGGREYFVHQSKYVKTRLKHIVESGKEEELRSFRKKFLIAYCESTRLYEDKPLTEHFWMLIRHLPKHEFSESMMEDLINEILKNNDAPDSRSDDAPGLSTDETLTALLLSDFDLKTLDQWDKIKSS